MPAFSTIIPPRLTGVKRLFYTQFIGKFDSCRRDHLQSPANLPKQGMIKILITLLLLSTPALSAEGHIGVQVVSLKGISMTETEAGNVDKSFSMPWWLHECCMQNNNPRGIFSPVCRTDPIKTWLSLGACERLGLTPAKNSSTIPE